MKKLSLILIGFLLVLTSCDGGGDDPVAVQDPAFTTLKNYMVTNDYDITKIIGSKADGTFFVTPPPATEADIPAFLAKYHVIDIRAKADYDAGHIAGAKNVTFSDILNEGLQDKPVLIVCYSGQTACYATALMRMYGFKSTKALKWGMSGWNPANADASWNKKIGANIADGHANWSYGAEPAKMVFIDPVIQSLKTDGSEILKDRVQQVITSGFGAATASGADVLANPSNYYINNYFNTADYSSFGHMDGAHRILPLSLAGGEYLNLDPTPGAKVITYCYTGQTSAIVTACLRVLGYDAYTLTFGMNGLYNTHTHWANVSNQWGGDSKPKNYPTVPTN